MPKSGEALGFSEATIKAQVMVSWASWGRATGRMGHALGLVVVSIRST
jgi:hypothetical protein